MILYDDEEEDQDFINEEEVDCARVWKSIRYIRPVKYHNHSEITRNHICNLKKRIKLHLRMIC